MASWFPLPHSTLQGREYEWFVMADNSTSERLGLGMIVLKERKERKSEFFNEQDLLTIIMSYGKINKQNSSFECVDFD